MANVQEEWLEKAIYERHINYIEYNKFTDPNVIGSGGFGNVFRYEWKDCELTVALKCLKVDTSINENIIKDFINELKLLRKVSCHPNVIAFYGVTKDNNGYYNMVLQYADDGTLREYLMTNFTKLQWTDKLCMAKEIALGLLFLHDNNIIHRDLHSKNILIHHRLPKIADFGLSKQMNEMSMTSNSIIHGMPAYAEPQCFVNDKYKRNIKSDVYSFGVILWEISSGRPPFSSFESGISLAFHILQGNREEPIEGTPSLYIELYKKCWDNDPANRPETRVIYNALKQFIPNETLNRNDRIETLSENIKISSSGQINALVNTFEIRSSPLYLIDMINSNTSVQVVSTLEDLRKEARGYFKQCKFLKALELFEEILKNNQHSPDDQEDASTWKLSWNKCGQENLNELAKVLYKNSTLTFLCLHDNNLGPEGGKALADALCKNFTLTSLNLILNKLGPEGGKALADALCKNSTLTSLDNNDNNLESEGGRTLADALCKNSSLIYLKLGYNNLGLKGGKALANALCKNSTLTSLDLRHNNFGSEVGKALADALCKNYTLKDLYLSENNLGSEGGKALADAVCKISTLKNLDLSSNELGSEEGKALADALCKNFTLTCLNLNENKLGFEGGKALADAFYKNSALSSLHLMWNELGTEGGKNSTLTSLHIASNDIGFELESNNSNLEIIQDFF
ncbi:kinase-like domain-containing protein [Gigaspora rosea]|uniref:Kinase-like domain-containing protein n=1 Tax=Gigaspora rosea TaxID=44941 RepID=A0A397VLL2_9GLOM|nr:kinase-like domain-containing protein [Gigaspora rosea]